MNALGKYAGLFSKKFCLNAKIGSPARIAYQMHQPNIPLLGTGNLRYCIASYFVVADEDKRWAGLLHYEGKDSNPILSNEALFFRSIAEERGKVCHVTLIQNLAQSIDADGKHYHAQVMETKRHDTLHDIKALLGQLMPSAALAFVPVYRPHISLDPAGKITEHLLPPAWLFKSPPTSKGWER